MEADGQKGNKQNQSAEKEVQNWECLGCGSTTPDTYQRKDFKFICYCNKRQLVCRPCYQKDPARSWVEMFGLEHAVHDNDESKEDRMMRLFGPLLTRQFNLSQLPVDGVERPVLSSSGRPTGAMVARKPGGVFWAHSTAAAPARDS
jgi:hypothetical protein